VDKLNILGVTINENMLASNYVENLISVCARSLFAQCVLRAHGLLDEALQSVTRSTTIARLIMPFLHGGASLPKKTRPKLNDYAIG